MILAEVNLVHLSSVALLIVVVLLLVLLRARNNGPSDNVCGCCGTGIFDPKDKCKVPEPEKNVKEKDNAK
jgi:hypothetical protein